MAGKEIDNNATGVLVLIIPIALAIVLLFKAWPALLIVVLLGVAWGLWRRYQLQRWGQQLNPIFHQLIEENQGCVTALDLAMKANLSGRIAKQFLDAKVEEFAAQKRNVEDKGTVYYFMTANTLGNIFNQSNPIGEPDSKTSIGAAKEFSLPQILEPNPPTESHTSPPPEEVTPEEPPVEKHSKGAETLPKKHPILQSLIQSELARRLDVHSSTVLKRRADDDFPEWSRSRDPEGIAWEYSPDTREFYPIETEPQQKR